MVDFDVEIGRPDTESYDRFKRVLNAGKHPTFIGREMVASAAHNGGMFFFVVGGADAAVALVKTSRSVLLVMCVHPKFRGSGLGTEVLAFLKPNFVRAVESAVPFFEGRGYTPIGTWKQGRSLRTRVMVRSGLITLSGRLRTRFARAEGSARDNSDAPARRARGSGSRLQSGQSR